MKMFRTIGAPGILAKAVLVLLLGLGTRNSLAGEDSRLAEKLWAGVKAAREQLKTGVVRITCERISQNGPNGSGRYELKAVDVSFDYAAHKRLYRVDDERKSQRIWLSTQDAWYGFRPGSGSVLEVLPPSYLRGKEEFAPDVRIAGMAAPSGLLAATTFETIDENRRRLGAFHEVRREGEGLYAVSWIIKSRSGDFLETIFINEAKGFTTEKYTLRSWKEGAPLSPARRPMIELSASWEPRGGTWVPTRVEASEAFSHTEFTFQWKSVNEPLAKDVFDVEKLGIPKGTLVVDSREKKQGVIIGKIGEPGYGPPPSRPRKKNAP